QAWQARGACRVTGGGRLPLIDLLLQRPQAVAGFAVALGQLVLVLGAVFVDLCLALRQLLLEGSQLRRLFGPADERQVLRLDTAGEYAVERVIVLLWDGGELVVVAASAADRHPLQAADGHVDAGVDEVVGICERTGG